MSLRDDLKKLAATNPELRKHLAPLLRQGAQTLDPKIIKKLERMTDQNAHTEAVVLLAKVVGNRKYLGAAEGIMKIHESLGSMDYDVSKFRSNLLEWILEDAERKFGKEIALQLHGAF